jgi:hypothetical protein
MSTSTVTTRIARLTTRNKVGLVLAVLLALGDVASLLQPPTADGETGPPFSILLVDGLLGVLTIVGVVIAWRSASRGAIRVVAGSRIISAITAMPAFFVDVPAGIKLLVGVIVLVTLATVVLIMTPARDRVAVTD